MKKKRKNRDKGAVHENADVCLVNPYLHRATLQLNVNTYYL